MLRPAHILTVDILEDKLLGEELLISAVGTEIGVRPRDKELLGVFENMEDRFSDRVIEGKVMEIFEGDMLREELGEPLRWANGGKLGVPDGAKDREFLGSSDCILKGNCVGKEVCGREVGDKTFPVGTSSPGNSTSPTCSHLS